MGIFSYKFDVMTFRSWLMDQNMQDERMDLSICLKKVKITAT